jgi:UDP-N-acetylglucosamine 4,6-dehydratase
MLNILLNKFSGKSVLVTGGTGSFGQAFIDLLLTRTDVSRIIVFSRDEKKQSDMRGEYLDSRVIYILGDVRDYTSVHSAMNGVNFVFHGAALKQVPSCELFPLEAVKTNVLGAFNVAQAAIGNKVEKCVFLSTDKAVLPVNAMGLTKSLMEKIIASISRDIGDSKTIFCCTRYGNVMNSRGSVIPLFIKQIKDNRPLTITDPLMTRFLMSLNEAVELVLYAFDKSLGGETYVLKSPASTIADLASALLNYYNSNLEPHIIGTRTGEKKHETLLTVEEMERSTENDRFFCVRHASDSINYNAFTKSGIVLAQKVDYTSATTVLLNQKEIIQKLILAKCLN